MSRLCAYARVLDRPRYRELRGVVRLLARRPARSSCARCRDSTAFSDDERLVLDLAVEMARSPVELPAELDARLRERFDEGQLVELSAAIAWEGYRARFNRVMGVEAVGFSEGASCALPEC